MDRCSKPKPITSVLSTAPKLLEVIIARHNNPKKTKLDARIAVLRQEVLKAERTLAQETKKRQMPCRCQGAEYIFTQEDFEESREIFEMARASWLADHSLKEGVGDV